jgi:hypothetical protein
VNPDQRVHTSGLGQSEGENARSGSLRFWVIKANFILPFAIQENPPECRSALGGKQNRARATKTVFLRFDMKLIPSLICFVCFSAGAGWAQSPVTLAVNTQSPGAAIPSDFLGLSFETQIWNIMAAE